MTDTAPKDHGCLTAAPQHSGGARGTKCVPDDATGSGVQLPPPGHNVAGLSLVPVLSNAELVVFDKDGTLTHCDKCFGPWLEAVAQKLVALHFVTDKAAFYKALDYCPDTKTFGKTASVVHDSNDAVRNDCAKEAYRQLTVLSHSKENVAPRSDSAASAAAPLESFSVFKDFFLQHCESGPEGNVWEVNLNFLTSNTLEPCGEYLQQIFVLLRDGGIKVSVCTSDDRRVCAHTMRTVGLDRHLKIGAHTATPGVTIEDSLACGDDHDIAQKPSPDGLKKLMAIQQTKPHRTVMVGDSFADMLAGLRSGCQGLVFVESGSHPWEELNEYVNGEVFKRIVKEENLGRITLIDSRHPGSNTPRVNPSPPDNEKVIYVMRTIDDLVVAPRR
eukprot:GHVU01229389.1.p1 GENE.GHVU01229389.1~~GHVU01229389.1.p1  ORF type:complete len:387 (+),score=69.84 GHVU01229389.1:169-1329(+)